MGMAILQNKWEDISKPTIVFKDLDFGNKKLQYSKLYIYNNISIVFAYINKTPGLLETQEIGRILQKEDSTFILGDLNIDINKEDGRKKINELSNILKMKQVNKESTRNRATLDLIFRKEDMKESDFMPFIFQNLYSRIILLIFFRNDFS